jgi:hypothetical protein
MNEVLDSHPMDLQVAMDRDAISLQAALFHYCHHIK